VTAVSAAYREGSLRHEKNPPAQKTDWRSPRKSGKTTLKNQFVLRTGFSSSSLVDIRLERHSYGEPRLAIAGRSFRLWNVPRFYAGRVIGRDRHYRGPGGTPLAGYSSCPRSGTAQSLPK
jgi:hypothetical protein